MSQLKYLDQLAEFHLKGADSLKPGMKVVFGHVSPLINPELQSSKAHPYGEIGTVLSVREASFNELHGYDHTEEWATKKNLVVTYRTETGAHTRYLTDSGVIPYAHGVYNDHNFVVSLDELSAAGFGFFNDISDEYKRRLERFNSQVIEEDDYTEV